MLCNPAYTRYALHPERIAAGLFLDLGFKAGTLVDLWSLAHKKPTDYAFLRTILGQLPSARNVYKDEKRESGWPKRVALRAWLSCHIASVDTKRSSTCPMLDLGVLPEMDLRRLSKLLRDADKLDALKPTVVENDVKDEVKHRNGNLELASTRYKSRIRTTDSGILHMKLRVDGKTVTRSGRVRGVVGRMAEIAIQGISEGTKIHSANTIGKDTPTTAEGQRHNIVRRAFLAQMFLDDIPFFQAIWVSYDAVDWAKTPTLGPLNSTDAQTSKHPLNTSQELAVRAILSSEPVCLVQGPPGTGKTTVIAESVQRIRVGDPRPSVYLIAQSNVAVKNIAEKFADVGFLDFRLLVSHEFHFDWHEHLYEQIGIPNVIRSDEFPKTKLEAERLMGGAKVILCTISMLSNPKLPVITGVVPVETVIVDEASQIEIGCYLHLIHHFQSTLAKLVLIGDDKQLPPFGQEDIPTLQSVFEITHLRQRAIFLDTQYRMPKFIGNFISRHVYDRKLKTVHSITTRKACRFVNIIKGGEEKRGHSWINKEEVDIILRLAAEFTKKGKSYRIITPYDAQRNLIENSLKAANLSWEDGVFNVDAFQGNEGDHIIISLVRTEKLGFLRNWRRSNVMLSRCKESMTICSNRTFLDGVGANSLAGKLSKECGDEGWFSVLDVRMGRL